MKMKAILLFALFISFSQLIHAQKNQDPSVIQIKTVDGNEFAGKITYEDSVSIVVTTQRQGPISIQKSDIKYKGNKNNFAELKKNGISVNLLGTSPLFGITYERLLSKYISLEAGIGLASLGAGIKIFPFKVNEGQFAFHSGFTIAHEYYTEYTVAYIPFGTSYFGKDRFNFGIDLGPAHFSDGYDNYIFFYGNIKLGIRF